MGSTIGGQDPAHDWDEKERTGRKSGFVRRHASFAERRSRGMRKSGMIGRTKSHGKSRNEPISDKRNPLSTTIEVRADAREFALYRKLVDSDWNRTTQESVLALIWQVIAESAVSSKDELACLLKFPAEKEAGKALETAAL